MCKVIVVLDGNIVSFMFKRTIRGREWRNGNILRFNCHMLPNVTLLTMKRKLLPHVSQFVAHLNPNECDLSHTSQSVSV